MSTNVITISDERYTSRFPVAVNGMVTFINAKEPTEVSDDVLEALEASGVEFTLAEKGGGGSKGVAKPSPVPISSPEAVLDTSNPMFQKKEPFSGGAHPAPASQERATASKAKAKKSQPSGAKAKSHTLPQGELKQPNTEAVKAAANKE